MRDLARHQGAAQRTLTADHRKPSTFHHQCIHKSAKLGPEATSRSLHEQGPVLAYEVAASGPVPLAAVTLVDPGWKRIERDPCPVRVVVLLAARVQHKRRRRMDYVERRDSKRTAAPDAASDKAAFAAHRVDPLAVPAAFAGSSPLDTDCEVLDQVKPWDHHDEVTRDPCPCPERREAETFAAFAGHRSTIAVIGTMPEYDVDSGTDTNDPSIACCSHRQPRQLQRRLDACQTEPVHPEEVGRSLSVRMRRARWPLGRTGRIDGRRLCLGIWGGAIRFLATRRNVSCPSHDH